MIHDTADMTELLGTDAQLLSADVLVPGSEIFALKITTGQLIAQQYMSLPIIGGRTSVSICREFSRNRYEPFLQSDFAYAGVLRDAVFVGGNPNYYHFMMFHFCSLYFLNAMEGEEPITLATRHGFPQSMTKLMEDVLPLFSRNRPVKMIHIGEGRFDLQNVIYPLHAQSPVTARVCKDILLPFVLRRSGVTFPAKLQGLKLFVRRDRPNTGRNLSNQAEIEEWLRARGYVSINPGNLPIEEQILTFARATHIVGVEGAGMTNLLFAISAVEVVMIASPLVAEEKFFPNIAENFPYAFRKVVGEITHGNAVSRYMDFSLPIATLAAAIKGP